LTQERKKTLKPETLKKRGGSRLEWKAGAGARAEAEEVMNLF
jgi:hypothetical protein